MSNSGDSIYRKIKSKLSDLERDERDLNSSIRSSENNIDSLANEREQAYVKLAEFYLPEMDAKSVKNTLRAVQSSVQDVLSEKQERREELGVLIDGVNVQRTEKEQDLEILTEHLNTKVTERDELSKTVSSVLNEQKDYTNLVSQAELLEETFAQNELRTKEVALELEKKLPAFENNKLFMYLVNKGFGTTAYKAGNLVTKLDSWVAKKVDFENSKTNFDFLNSMPELMQVEVQKSQEEYQGIRASLKQIEDKVSKDYGLTDLIEEGDKLGEKRSKLMGTIDSLNSQYNSHTNELKSLDNTKGVYYETAIRQLRSYLKSDDIQGLKQKARDSPSDEDDRLVYRLETIDVEVRNLKDKIKDVRNQRDELQDKIHDVEKLKSKFRNKDYESSRSYFDSSFSINRLLDNLVDGTSSYSSVWSSIDSSQHFRARQPSYNYSSSTSSSSWSSSSSSSFSSGSSSFGGGGFSSGSGF